MSIKFINYYEKMQYVNKETQQITEALANVIKELRNERTGLSASNFAESYGFDKSKILRVERGEVNCKLITAWAIANALGMKCSELIAIVEELLGEDFSLIEE